MSNLGRVGLVAAVVLGAAVGWLGCSSGSSATTSTPTKDASTRQCAPGALQCTSASVQAVCQVDGSGWVSAACAAGDVCSSGVCKSQSSGTACTPNTKTCASTSVARVCPSDGSGWIADACAAGQTCIQGVCSGVDSGPACAPNTGRCVNSSLAQVCPSDGSGWLTVECASGQSCASGVCVTEAGAPTCAPNAQQCATSTTAEVCSPDGSQWLAIPCQMGQTCAGGACAWEAGATMCKPGTARCATATVPETCSNDGSTWVMGTDCAVELGAGFICSKGACSLNPAAPCTAGETLCATSTSSATCQADGSGWSLSSCPTGTQCVAVREGYYGTTTIFSCEGALPVGPLECGPPVGDSGASTTIEVSTDGFTISLQDCPSGEYCIPTIPPACVAGSCTPDPEGCNAVCGNKVDPLANQADYISTCSETVKGWTWTAQECPSPETCDPKGGGSCGSSGKFAPSCSEVCTPGSTRCAPDGSGVQTCEGDGAMWGTAVPCNAAAGLVCSSDPSTGNGVCGNPVCFAGSGTCTATGLFQPCVSFLLKPLSAATACASGTTCTPTGIAVSGAYQPGACTSECAPGEAQCTAGGVETCTAAGVWGVAAACTGGDACYGYMSPSGTALAVCGVCQPGTHECTGAGASQIEQCGDDGQWGAATACTVGACSLDSSTGDYACLQQCVPGTLFCGGTNGTQKGLCTGSGMPPTVFQDCGTDSHGVTTSCLTDGIGAPIGCVECMGPNHGVAAQTMCSGTSAGSPGTAAIDTCGADDMWGTPVACDSGLSCAVVSPSTCGSVTFDPSGLPPWIGPATQGNLQSAYGSSTTCQGYGWGAPGWCGGYADCCSDYCQAGGLAVPTCQ